MHKSTNCNELAICFLCKSTKHKDGECKTPTNKQCCINCDQNHHSFAKRCKVFKEIKNNLINDFIKKLENKYFIQNPQKARQANFINSSHSLNNRNSSKYFAQAISMSNEIDNVCIFIKENINYKLRKMPSKFEAIGIKISIEDTIINIISF